MVVDIYHQTPVSHFADVRLDVRGLIHKATEGENIVDQKYRSRRPLAIQADLLWGAYHFLRPGDMEMQAQHFLDAAQPDDKTLVAIDHEDDRVSLGELVDICTHIANKLGRKPVIYSGWLIKEQLGHNIRGFLAEHKLWLAQYGPTPVCPSCWKDYWLWQYTGDGVGQEPHEIRGIEETGIDLNHYNGTPEQLEKEWAS
jgi:GH25 family lysozyme M1 (1,4-beta-N-acetylmuramidase)